MEEFLLFVFATIGMAHIVVDGSIMEPLRRAFKLVASKLKVPKIGEVVECYMCCGTWCGFLMGWIFYSKSNEIIVNLPIIFACGCAGGFLSNVAAMVLNWIEAATIMNMPEKENE